MIETSKILITGSSGQLGTVLYQRLIDLYGEGNVIASDIHANQPFARYESIDVTDFARLSQLIQDEHVTEVYHLAAILSATAEQNPQRAWNINMSGLLNVLEASTLHQPCKVFFPSSIAVFGNFIDRKRVDQHAVQHPTTLYGISKSAGENWCQYYAQHRGVDVRSLRYPGVIGHQSLPGGGTTDYAVHIFHEAIRRGHYTSYLAPNTVLPMIHMDDAIDATIALMTVPTERISIRTSYNIQALSFSPATLGEAIRKYMPSFSIDYAPDYRQAIADNWPESMKDDEAKSDWGWSPKYDLDRLVSSMLEHLSTTLAV